MARHRSNRSNVPVTRHRPGQHSRSTYRQLYRQPHPGTHERPLRIRQRRNRQRIRSGHVHDAHRPALRAHGVRVYNRVPIGVPGIFWWHWA